MTLLRDRRWSESEQPDALWPRLNEAWRDLVLALRGIPRDVFRDVEFTGPSASLTFTVDGMVTRPRGVQLVALYRTDNGGTTAVSFAWSYGSSGITTTAFSGLAATTWRATFRVTLGGE
jgi:hypothetical protein